MPTPRLPRIALALTFAALCAHAVATLGAPPARYDVRDATVEEAPERLGSTHYELRAALRADEGAAPMGGKYRAKAALMSDAVAATCATTDALFANGFE